MEVMSFVSERICLLIMTLQVDLPFTTINLTKVVGWRLEVKDKSIRPLGYIDSPENSYNGVIDGFIFFGSKPIASKVS